MKLVLTSGITGHIVRATDEDDDMMPSREFMIQQATLNAAISFKEPHAVRPLFESLKSVPWVLRCLISGDYVRPTLVDIIRKEYCSLLVREQLIQSGRTCQN